MLHVKYIELRGTDSEMDLPEVLLEIAEELNILGKKVIVVGGAVRDHLLNMEIKDYDIEVYGMSENELTKYLSTYGKVNAVGKSYGVIKVTIDNEEYDFTLPRLEENLGNRHTDVEVTIDVNLSYIEAFKRRDFTMNAIGYDIVNKSYIDPYNGVYHVNNHILKHVNDKSFVEDPLRVFRAIQFISRFDLQVDITTEELCKKMVSDGMLDNLPMERVYTEFNKLLLKGKVIEKGWNFMNRLGVVDEYYKELKDIPNTTLDALNNLTRLQVSDDYVNRVMTYSILCYSLHTNDMVTFMNRLTKEKILTDMKSLIYATHTVFPTPTSEITLNSISLMYPIKYIYIVMRTLHGIGTNIEYDNAEAMKLMALDLGIWSKALKPFILGRDLITLGYKPSKKFTPILDDIFWQQIHCNVTTKDEAIKYITDVYAK